MISFFSTRPRLRTFFLLLFGTLALALGVFTGARTAWFVLTAVRTQGSVVALEKSLIEERVYRHPSVRRTRETFRPVFEFRDALGMPHRVTESFGSNPPLFQPGDAVPVLYNPKTPAEAHIRAARIQWLTPGLVTAAGIGLLAFGCYLRRRQKQAF